MTSPSPIYTAENCRCAYQLNWSLSIFWKQPVLDPDLWLGDLKQSVEPDAVRILEHYVPKPDVSQLLLSTKPNVTPSQAIRAIKGRLQYLIRDKIPKPFRRNYSMISVGSAGRDAVEAYVAGQVNHHQMADSRTQDRFVHAQISEPSIDLTAVRRSAYGEFLSNLHVVLVNADRGVDVREAAIHASRNGLIATAKKKGHLLSCAGIVSDHLHFTIGCDVTEAPGDVAIAYMNNIAYAHGMKPVFQYGFYVGTFGPYDLDAIRQRLKG